MKKQKQNKTTSQPTNILICLFPYTLSVEVISSFLDNVSREDNSKN